MVHSDDSLSVCLYVGGKDEALQEFLFLLLVPLIKNIREDLYRGCSMAAMVPVRPGMNLTQHRDVSSFNCHGL